MTGMRSFFLAILFLLPITALPSSEKYVCDGKFKDGSKPTPEELKKILGDHKAWFESEKKENDKRRANLCNVKLSQVDLKGANLMWADLSGAKLTNVDLSGADLMWADLSGPT